MGDEKRILYNNVEPKRLWGKWNEPPPTTRDSSSSKEGDVYMVGMEGSLLLWAPSGKTINSNKYWSQLDQLKVALDEKRPELVNINYMIFHQDNTSFFNDQAKIIIA